MNNVKSSYIFEFKKHLPNADSKHIPNLLGQIKLHYESQRIFGNATWKVMHVWYISDGFIYKSEVAPTMESLFEFA